MPRDEVVTASSPECHLVFPRGWPSMAGTGASGALRAWRPRRFPKANWRGRVGLMLSRRAAGSWLLTRLGVNMEDRECRKCGVRTQHERVDLTERAIDWTVFVCSQCGAVARAPRA